MSVAIRLKKLGTKNKPAYRIVAVDKRKSRDGSTLMNLGHYNPLPKQTIIILEEEKVLSFLKNGANPSETVRNILRQRGIIKTAQGTWEKRL